MSEDGFSMSRRGALAALASIGVGSAAIGAGTFAAFSDTEDANTNNWTAQSMDLTAGGDSQTTSITINGGNDIKPGDSGTTSAVTLSNTGGVSGELAVTLDSITTSENDSTDEPEPEAEYEDANGETTLADELDVLMWVENPNKTSTSGSFNEGSYDYAFESGGTVVTGGTSYSKELLGNFSGGTTWGSTDGTDSFVSIGNDYEFYITWSLPSDASNGVMTDSASLDFTFEIHQNTA